MTTDPFSSLLGMSEMEWAVKAMLERLFLNDRPTSDFSNMRISVTQHDQLFVDNSVGFCALIARGWLKPVYPNSEYVVSQELVDRLRTREVWKDLPDADELYGFGMSLKDLGREMINGETTCTGGSPTLQKRVALRRP